LDYLPQSVASEISALQARELKLVRDPPPNLTPAQLDQELAELRWKIARQFGTHDIAGAISYARASLSLDSAHDERWEQLGDLCNLSGEITSAQDAGQAYQKALAIEPSRHSARLKLASAYLMLGRPELAIKHLELYLLALDDAADPQALNAYVSACAAAGETARGLAFCKARSTTGGVNQYRIAWAIFEKARGNRYAAITILNDVENSENKMSPLSIYAGNLRQSYLSGKGK
jgi:tetratricopeptide (TPR) repeat protein